MTRSKINAEAQRTRFIEAARALGADDDEATFKEKLRVIARQKVKDAPLSKLKAKSAFKAKLAEIARVKPSADATLTNKKGEQS